WPRTWQVRPRRVHGSEVARRGFCVRGCRQSGNLGRGIAARMSYEQLIREHAQIEVRVKRLLELVSGAVPDVDGVTIALSDLSGELGAHLAHEDSFIYPRMIRGNNALMRDAANAFTAEFASLRVDWSVYLSEWTADCIE